ncbi:MAG: LysM peptidoglycan-binding domain-containing protein [Synechococcaceae cyanobacterium]
MRRTLAALALALTLPTSGLLVPAAHAQAAVVVKAGETLSEIAERHGVSLTRLMQANGISDPDLVVVGQRLTIPGGSGQARGSGGSVMVQAGDTLSDIAARHGVGLTRLMQANGISDPDLVVVGQRLTIPGAGGSAPAARNQQPTAPYTVKSGETLSEIAVRFNTSTERLIQLNGIQDPDQVISGTRLRIPMAPRSAAAKPSAAPARSSPDRNTREHVVQGGESLSAIAERYGTSVTKLVALNRIDDPDRLLAGTRLQLRGTPPPPKSKPAPKPQPTAQTSPQPAAKPSPQPAAKTAPEPSPQPQSQAKPKVAAAAAPASAVSTATPPASPAAAASTTTPMATARAAATPSTTTSTTTSTSAAASQQRRPRTTPQSAPVQQTGKAPANRIGAATEGVKTATSSSGTTTTASARSTTATAAATGATTAARPAKASTGPSTGGDWRPYGPLQIDWSKWQSMGGSYVAPSLNKEGKARYLAVNCKAGKLNTTTTSGQWNSWASPEEDFEKKLVQDICKEKGS